MFCQEKSSAGGEVQYRTLGITLDFYLYIIMYHRENKKERLACARIVLFILSLFPHACRDFNIRSIWYFLQFREQNSAEQ
jgi:hypothetical protein